MRAPDPLRLIIGGAVLAIVALRVGVWLRQDARDPPPPHATGTGSIAGVVVDHLGNGVAKASVSITQQNDLWGRVTTDASGRFAFKQLPAGNYLVDAHTLTSFNAARLGTTLTSMSTRLADGQVRDGIRITIVPGGSIEGVVHEEDGTPVGKKYVKAIRIDQDFNERRYFELPITPTDADGHYRVDHVPPGDYVIMGALDALSLRRVYYPNASRISAAVPITIGIAEARQGIDLHARRVPTAAVTGIVDSPDGKPVTLVLDLVRSGPVEPDPRHLTTTSGPDGKFKFEAIPADKYWIVAHSATTQQAGRRGEPEPGRQMLWGMADVTTDGTRPVDVHVHTEPGQTVTGILEFHTMAGTEPPKNAEIWLRLIGADRRSSVALYSAALRTTVDDQHHFSITGAPPGTFILAPMVRPGWWLESARIGKSTPSDGTFTIAHDGSPGDVEITFIDKPGTVSGTLRDAGGQLLPGRLVVIFSEDAKAWRPYTGRVQAGPTDQDGQFSVVGLVAGTYLAAVLDEGPVTSWRSPQTLERLRASARHLTLETGEQKSLDLVAKR